MGRRSSRATGLGFLIALLVLLIQLPFFGSPINANNSTRMMLTMSLVEDGSTEIDRWHDLTMDKALHGEHYYSDKAPGMSFLSVPSYAALRAVGMATGVDVALLPSEGGPSVDPKVRLLAFRVIVLLSSGLLTAIGAVALFHVARAMSRGDGRVGVVTALMFSAATPVLGWSVNFFGHAGAAASLVVAFAAAFFLGDKKGPSRARRTLLAICAGAFLGLAVTVEYTSAPAVALVGGYGIFRVLAHGPREALRLIGFALVGGLLCLVPLAVYHTVSFGGPFKVGYSNLVGWEGMDEGFHGLTLPDPVVLFQLIFGPYRGILWLSPILVFVPVGAVMLYSQGRYRAEMLLASLVIAYYFLLNASYYYWDGGWSAGPRHVTAAIGFMCLLIVPVWRTVSAWVRRFAYVLLGVSLVVNLAAATTTMTPSDSYPFPLWDPIARSLMDGITTWAVLGNFGIQPLLAFVVWLAAVVALLALILRRVSAPNAAS